ncbi:MAG: diversity-generating retroelement protein Avd [Bacteroidetes bacterium]|nr:diversity-generating retroelement protein Avd [Bacteroidota bacterium]
MSKANNYPVFIKWYKTLDWILDRCEKMPKHVRFSISSRVAGIALDVQEKIIEAIYRKERKEILSSINLDLEKLRVFFRIIFERRYISEKQYAFISNEINETGRMIGGWMR